MPSAAAIAVIFLSISTLCFAGPKEDLLRAAVQEQRLDVSFDPSQIQFEADGRLSAESLEYLFRHIAPQLFTGSLNHDLRGLPADLELRFAARLLEDPRHIARGTLESLVSPPGERLDVGGQDSRPTTLAGRISRALEIPVRRDLKKFFSDDDSLTDVPFLKRALPDILEDMRMEGGGASAERLVAIEAPEALDAVADALCQFHGARYLVERFGWIASYSGSALQRRINQLAMDERAPDELRKKVMTHLIGNGDIVDGLMSLALSQPDTALGQVAYFAACRNMASFEAAQFARQMLNVASPDDEGFVGSLRARISMFDDKRRVIAALNPTIEHSPTDRKPVESILSRPNSGVRAENRFWALCMRGLEIAGILPRRPNSSGPTDSADQP